MPYKTRSFNYLLKGGMNDLYESIQLVVAFWPLQYALQAVEIIIVNGKFVPICWLQILRVCSNIIFAQHPSHFIYCH